jgi:hypothetical protein
MAGLVTAHLNVGVCNTTTYDVITGEETASTVTLEEYPARKVLDT